MSGLVSDVLSPESSLGFGVVGKAESPAQKLDPNWKLIRATATDSSDIKPDRATDLFSPHVIYPESDSCGERMHGSQDDIWNLFSWQRDSDYAFGRSQGYRGTGRTGLGASGSNSFTGLSATRLGGSDKMHVPSTQLLLSGYHGTSHLLTCISYQSRSGAPGPTPP